MSVPDSLVRDFNEAMGRANDDLADMQTRAYERGKRDGAESMRGLLQRFAGYVLTTKRSNTNEWMMELAVRVQEVANVIEPDTRVEYSPAECQLVQGKHL